MMRAVTSCGIAALLLVAAPPAFADTCYDLANSQNLDCSSPRGDAPSRAAPKPAAPDNSKLRDELRRRLGSANDRQEQAAAEQLRRRIGEAQSRADTALREPAAPGARERYDAALKDLRRAYDDAEKQVSPQGRAAVAESRKAVEAHYAELAARADWQAAAPAASPQAPADNAQAAAVPANIAEVNGYVFVCDGPVDSAHVSCREIQHDARQCIAIMLDEGVLGWRDSIDTPCSASDLAQRQAFLASNREAAEIAAAAAMSDECRDLALNYVAAADAKNGPASQAALERIQNAGGCGLLSHLQAQATPPASDPRFVSRGATPMLDQTVAPCDQQPGACAALVNQLRAGTSPEALAALYNNAIGIGLQIGAAMGQVVLGAQQMNMPRVAQPNMNSLAPAPIRNTRAASGAPVYRPPPPAPVPGCKIGGVGWCTAQ
jgi:hypothetical protein